MSRNTRPPHSRASSSASRSRTGVTELDPGTVREVDALFFTFLKRLGLTLLIMVGVAATAVFVAQPKREISALIFFLSLVFGLALAYRRGVGPIFQQLKRLGLDRARQGRHADAAFILEQFHHLGNRGFDREGEAHYHLLSAYRALGQHEKAAEIGAWLKRHRRKSTYADQVDKDLANSP